MQNFESILAKALTACDLALEDILAARRSGGSVDVKTLKEVSAAMKDLNAVSPEATSAAPGFTVRVDPSAEGLSL